MDDSEKEKMLLEDSKIFFDKQRLICNKDFAILLFNFYQREKLIFYFNFRNFKFTQSIIKKSR